MYSAHIAIVGGGSWGRALAAAAARSGTKAYLVTRRTDDAPPDVTVRRTVAGIGKEARLVLLAVPSTIVPTMARELGDHVDGRHLLVHAVRGLSASPLRSISRVLTEETPARRVGAIGGPVLVDELERGEPSVLVAASAFPEVTDAIDQAFGSPKLRVYTTRDLAGVEWASALVGCLAVAVGFAEEIGVNAGMLATLISRGIDEAARIAVQAGGHERTILSLAGYGDLLACIRQEGRAEVMAGRALARGKTIEEAKVHAKERVEALELIPRVRAFASEHNVHAPIFDALEWGILARRPAAEILERLMAVEKQVLPS